MKINSIQFLRAIAVILVVHVHAIDLQMSFAVSRQQKFYFLQNFGAIGVDLFFAISGFIISYVASNYSGHKAGLAFLNKRFLRINPVYYLASLIYLVLICFTNQFIPFKAVLNGLRDMILMIPVLNSQTMLLPILIVGWSLSFEWWFYLLFYSLIFFKVHNKTFLLILVLPLLVAMGYILHVKDFRLVFISNPIMLEFLLGVFIFYIYNHVQISYRLAALLLLLGIGGYVYNIFYGFGDISELMSVMSGKSSMKRVLLWGMPSAAILAGCIFLEKNGVLHKLWDNWLFLLIGEASYAIYLTHYIMMYLLALLYKQTGFFINADLSVFVHILIAIAIGIVFYRKLERPLIKLLQPGEPIKTQVPASS